MPPRAYDLLWDIAVDQHGYVSLSDAYALGISLDAMTMLARRGRIQRVSHGVYRIPQFANGPGAPYMEAVLWTGDPRACLSHDTALAVYELCDINPVHVHLTVPRGKRIRRSGGRMYVLHREDLANDEIGWWDEIPTVKPATAIRQGIDGSVPTYLIRQALDNGSKHGLITRAAAVELEQRLEARR